MDGYRSLVTSHQNLGLRVVTGYHWLPEFWSQGGYRLLLVTIILVSWSMSHGCFGYHWLPEFQNKGAYRLPLVTKFDDLDRATDCQEFYYLGIFIIKT